MTTLEIVKETKSEGSTHLAFYCHTTLSDSQQIIIEIEGQDWGSNGYKKNGVFSSYRLEKLNYQVGYAKDNEGVKLYSIVVRGFRKDKGLKFRETQVYNLDQSVLDQIPDEYHDYARNEFAKGMAELQEELTDLTNKGLQIGTKQFTPVNLNQL